MLCIERPLREKELIALVIYLLSPLAIRMNKKGERGSPCLMPLEGLKVGVGEPFKRMEKKEEEMREEIQWIHVG